MITPLSTLTPYCPVGEFLKRADLRLVCELASDTKTAVAPSTLPTNANLAAALMDASGRLESSCLVGGRYKPEDLNMLTGAAQCELFRFVTDLAVLYLYRRRPDLMPLTEFYKLMDEYLKNLRQGELIFGTVEHAAAGRPHHVNERASHVENREGLAVQAEAYFGTRTNRTLK